MYTKMVSRYTEQTIMALASSQSFLEEFYPFRVVKHPEEFKRALMARYELIRASYEDSLLETVSLNGLTKAELTESDMQYQRDVAFIEKVIAYGRIAAGLEALGPVESSLVSIVKLILLFVEQQLSGDNRVQIKRAYEISKGSETLMTAYKKAGAYLKEVFYNEHFNKRNAYTTTFAKYTSNGFLVDVNKDTELSELFDINTQLSISVRPEMFYRDSKDALSRMLLISKEGVAMKYKGVHNSLDNDSASLSFFTALYLARAASVDMATLQADTSNVVVVVPNTRKGGVVKSNNPADVVISAGLDKHFGPSSPDLYTQGVLRLNKSYEGFAELYGDIYVSTESSANKAVARVIKLNKDTKHQLTLNTVYVVVDTMDNQAVVRALSTGQILVPTSVSRTHGQIRAVSSADRGGFKCTTSPVALFDTKLDEAGVTLASFSSMKAKGYGIAKLLGMSEDTIHEDVLSRAFELKTTGGPIKCVEVSNVVLDITNHYSIQTYKLKNRDAIVASLEEADEAIYKRAQKRASTITEDSILVDYIISLRDEKFDGDLEMTIKHLLQEGEIVRKPSSVAITSSEFGIMNTTHGADASNSWMDSLLAENTNSRKLGEVYRAIKTITGTQESQVDTVKKVSSGQFAMDMYKIFKANHVDTNRALGAFVSRNLLVDLALYFSDEGGSKLWMAVEHPNKGSAPTVCYLPLGEHMYGDFHEDSSIYEHKVQVTGFLSSLLKQLPYMLKFITEHLSKLRGELPTYYKGFPKVYNQFVKNMAYESQAYFLGKGVGKLYAQGTTGVLSVSWWDSESKGVSSTVYSLARVGNTEGKQAVLVKHPELFKESITGVNVRRSFPKHLTEKLTEEQLRIISFSYESSVYIPETMALALQNDADGDLVRLSYHSNFSLLHFSGEVLHSDNFSHKFHTSYMEKEKDFTSGALAPVKFTSFSNIDILNGVKLASKAKEGVARYTALAQRIERYSSLSGMDKSCPKYKSTHLLFCTMVQEFSMNAIKHSSNQDAMLLPDYFLISTKENSGFSLDFHSEYAPKFFDFLNDIGADTATSLEQAGFSSQQEWLSYIENLLLSMQDFFKESEDLAYVMLGKDFLLGQDSLRKGSPKELLSSSVYGRIVSYFFGILSDSSKSQAPLF